MSLELKHQVSFKEIWEILGDCYRTLSIRCLAVKEEGTWKNVMIVAWLSLKDQNNIRRDTENEFLNLSELGVTNLENLALLYEVKSSEETPKFVEDLKTGKITIMNQPVEVSEEVKKIYVSKYPRTIDIGNETKGYQTISYELGGGSFSSREEALISERLKELGILGGIDEVGLMWLKLPNVRAYSINAIINLPIYLKLHDLPKMQNRKFHVSFLLHKELRDKLRLLIALRRRYPGAEVTMESSKYKLSQVETSSFLNDFVVCSIEHEFKTMPKLEDYVYFNLSCKLGAIFKDSQSVRDMYFTERLGSGEEFLNSLIRFVSIESLESILLKEEDIGKRGVERADIKFQRSIAWILSAIGFKIAELGDTKYGVVRRRNGVDIGDVDILIQDPESKKVYAVFCKVNPVESKDIDTTVNVVDKLRRDGLLIEPIIFIGSLAPESKENIRKVKVLDRDDIVKILQLLRVNNLSEAKRILLS